MIKEKEPMSSMAGEEQYPWKTSYERLMDLELVMKNRSNAAIFQTSLPNEKDWFLFETRINPY